MALLGPRAGRRLVRSFIYRPSGSFPDSRCRAIYCYTRTCLKGVNRAERKPGDRWAPCGAASPVRVGAQWWWRWDRTWRRLVFSHTHTHLLSSSILLVQFFKFFPRSPPKTILSHLSLDPKYGKQSFPSMSAFYICEPSATCEHNVALCRK